MANNSTTIYRDLVLLAVYAIAVFMLAIFAPTEPFINRIIEQSSDICTVGLCNSLTDEVAVMLMLLPIALAVFSLRRWRELGRENTKRNKAEEASFRLASIVENSTDAIDSKTPDGTIVSLNPSAERLYGYSEEELKGKHISVLAPPEHLDEMLEILERVGRGETVKEVETERVSKDGRRIPISLTLSPVRDSGGNIVGVSAIARDITERKRAEEVQGRLAAILEGTTDFVGSADADGRVLYINGAGRRMVGIDPDEDVSNRILFDFHPERLHRHIRDQIMPTVMRFGSWSGETVFLSRDRQEIPVSAVGIAHKNRRTGMVEFVSIIARDITERKRYEEELRQAREAAEAANRAKSDFLANMSHEIRTPMNGVVGMTGLLLDTDLSPEQREYAETVRTSGENLLSIVNDILDFSKIEAGRMEIEKMDFNLQRVVEETVDLLAEQAHNKGLELVSCIEQGVPTAIRCDAGRIRQVLVNLLDNAIKFTEQGEVVLRVGLVEESDEAAIVRFEMKDTGIGMTEEQRSRLFQPFSQADTSTTRRYGGTGLGLAISKQLVELMGGEIGVQSEPEEGSTFFFTLPLEKQPEGVERRAASAPRARHFGDLRVLVVDDNETNRKIMHDQVVSWGMDNGTAGDGQRALTMLRAAAERGEAYDLAIIDMQMPGMDGMQLARRIKADPSIASTRLVLLTSMGRRGDSADAGIEAYLTKPVRQSRFYDTIATVVGAPEEEEDDAGRRPGHEASTVNPRSLEEARAGSRARLLVAEDNAVNQKVAVRMLERLGYRADVAANGLEAVEATSRIPYQAVLMDVQMPEMDGYAATAEIREREGAARHTPVIAMTANALAGDREKALEAGMDDYVPKPVKPEELDEVLKRWVPQEEAIDAAIARSGGSASPTETEDPLDPAVIANLRELGGPEMLSELAQMYVDVASSSLRGLREAVEGDDARAVERIAHTLKGSSGSMGAKGMAEICAELETAGASGDLSHAPGLLGRLEEEFGRVRPVLEAEAANGRHPQ